MNGLLGAIAWCWSAALGGARDDVPPRWLADAFVSRSVAAGAEETAIALLDDGAVDLVARRTADGAVVVERRQPGTIVAAGGASDGRGAFAEFAALTPEQWLAFTFDVGADGRPRPTVAKASASLGERLLIRTIRRRDDGGGALARLVVRAGATAADVRLDLEVLALSPDRAPLPGAHARERPPAFPASGTVLLFDDAAWGHPAWGTFDLVTLDRDHPSWRRGRDEAPTTLAQRSLEPLDVDLAGRGFGFVRALRMTRVDERRGEREGASPLLLRWRELKADALAPDGAVESRPLVLLREDGEAAIGAWAVAGGSALGSELHPSLFTAQADDEGRIALPVQRRADPTELEVFAFTAGARARFGTRRGVVAPTGGECVVLLDQRATTTLTVSPPPGRATWIGFNVKGGTCLLPLAADGVVKLPAFNIVAFVYLGAPYRGADHHVFLKPDAAITVKATLLAPD